MIGKRKKSVLCIIMTAIMLVGLAGYPDVTGYATAVEETENTGDADAGNESQEAAGNESSADTSTAGGAGTDDGITDASVEKAREDADEAGKKLESAQEILNNLKKSKLSMEQYVVELDKSINELQIEITHLEQNQKELEATIEDAKQQLTEAQEAQQQQYDDMKQRIQMVYESGNKQYLDVLLTATSMTDMLNKSEYVGYVSLYDYNVLKKLKQAKEHVANIKQKLDRDLKSNQKLQAEVNKQKENIEALIADKKVQIEQYSSSIAGQEEEVRKYQQAKAEAESIIAAAEAAAAAAAAAAEAAATYTGGAFTWPVPGQYTITSYFGGRVSPVVGASSDHKGIDIACNTGDPVVAAASGTVIVAAYNYAEGNYVCIDHGGGVVTLYMHNTSLAVSVGEYVSAGQTIAYAGSTGISTGPHCHFGVRINGAYVDPLTYLQ